MEYPASFAGCRPLLKTLLDGPYQMFNPSKYMCLAGNFSQISWVLPFKFSFRDLFLKSSNFFCNAKRLSGLQRRWYKVSVPCKVWIFMCICVHLPPPPPPPPPPLSIEEQLQSEKFKSVHLSNNIYLIIQYAYKISVFQGRKINAKEVK